MRAIDASEPAQDSLQNESAAIAGLQRGDLHGLDVLVQQHQLRAVRTAFLIAGDRALAEDAVADAFVAVVKHIDRFDARRPFAPWFMRIVVNGTLTALRRNKRSMSLNTIEDWPDAQPLLEDVVAQNEQRSALLRALAALSSEQRTAVVLRFFLDMPEREVAEVMRAPLGTVKWRLHAARRALRHALTHEPAEDALTGQWET